MTTVYDLQTAHLDLQCTVQYISHSAYKWCFVNTVTLHNVAHTNAMVHEITTKLYKREKHVRRHFNAMRQLTKKRIVI